MFQRLLLFITIYCLGLPAALGNSNYSAGGWPTLHQDAGNRRAVETLVASEHYNIWHHLAGASVLTAPTTSPDGQQIYVTTGLARGNSNLHAFSIQGELLWQSTPWQTADDSVDACAILSSPIVDRQGDIYINDCNQMFAFKPDGQLKWVTALPPTQAGDWIAAGKHPVNAITTAAFTIEGYILGVTNFGDVLIIDRHSGKVLNQAYRLPGLIPPKSTVVPMPDSLFGDGMLDPQFKEWTWQLIFGGLMRSANTPAVADNGRLYMVGSASKKGFGALYALDMLESAQGIILQPAFITEIGLGSGSSPALSPTADQVYVCDEEGWFYGIDASTGSIRWKIKTRATAGAAAVARDGTIYALQAHAPALIALSPQGKVLWQSDFSALAQQLPVSFLFGDPVAVGNGNPTVVKNAVLVPIIYGYEIPLGAGIPLPIKSTIAAVDLKTGKALRDVVALADDSSGITVVLANGTIVSSLGGAMTSGVSPLQTIINWLLPADFTLLPPTGGVQVALPVAK